MEIFTKKIEQSPRTSVLLTKEDATLIISSLIYSIQPKSFSLKDKAKEKALKLELAKKLKKLTNSDVSGNLILSKSVLEKLNKGILIEDIIENFTLNVNSQ